MSELTIDVSAFSNDPWGRDENDNPTTNGRAFRQQYLLGAFNDAANKKITVDFSKLDFIPDSAFLGGAFVGLAKENGFSYEDILNRLDILPKDGYFPELVKRILELAQEEEIRLQGA